jgi:type IV secretion system protein VirB2
MLRHRLSRLLPAATTLAAFATPALAQDLSPIQTMLETVEAALTGPIGIVLIFSAGTIVDGFS